MTAYYNENDKKAAAWLRELIASGRIPYGEVDERSISEVLPSDLTGYVQCHFFAGIGGWSPALRLAGWPDDRPVWTGSCPCQPFSAAGKRAGTDDERHLWPAFRWLIDQCRPPAVFGEQVASRLGREWLAGVRADLEALGYAVGAADLCAAGVGAPHIRQRLWWVADAEREQEHQEQQKPAAHERGRGANSLSGCGLAGRMGHPHNAGSQGRGVLSERANELSPWAASLGNWLPCADGKARRIEPGIEPLAHGVPGRVGLLRGYGNAIVPQVATAFIRAYEESQCLN